MMGWLLLLVCFCLGAALTAVFFPFLKKTPFFWGVSFFLGLFWTGTIIFLLKGALTVFF